MTNPRLVKATRNTALWEGYRAGATLAQLAREFGITPTRARIIIEREEGHAWLRGERIVYAAPSPDAQPRGVARPRHTDATREQRP